ncbi:hypothetical protein ACIBKX_28215 [Streptomyces sp. NPDC050658]|uniref:hypothetical protein n=1 Tax=unclassified Streptomyces TaxID=2593676 RepID=UPI00342AF706
MKLRLAATAALCALLLAPALTACNDSGKSAASDARAQGDDDVPAYESSGLEDGEKKFMDTFWAVSDDRKKLREADAKTIQDTVSYYSTLCLDDEASRSKTLDQNDRGAKMSAADKKRVLASLSRDLCAEPDKKAWVKDVALTRKGREKHEVWGDTYVFHWKITNSGKEAADYFAQVEFFDKDGDFLGSTGITAERLGPGKSSKGDSAPLDAEITNGKIADIADAKVAEVTRTSK